MENIDNSLLSNENILLDFFRLKYKDLPDSLDKLDVDIKDTIILINKTYIEKTISFEEAFDLISQLFGGINKDKKPLYDKPLSADLFYTMLLDDKIDQDLLTKLLEEKKISYQLYFDGISYLSRENENNQSFSR